MKYEKTCFKLKGLWKLDLRTSKNYFVLDNNNKKEKVYESVLKKSLLRKYKEFNALLFCPSHFC